MKKEKKGVKIKKVDKLVPDEWVETFMKSEEKVKENIRHEKKGSLWNRFQERYLNNTAPSAKIREEKIKDAEKEFKKTFIRRYVEYKVRSVCYLIRFTYNATKWLLFSVPVKPKGFPHSVKNYDNFDDIMHILKDQEERRQTYIKNNKGREPHPPGIQYIGELGHE